MKNARVFALLLSAMLFAAPLTACGTNADPDAAAAQGNTVSDGQESDSASDTAFLAMANTEEFLGLFTGKTVPVEGVDVTGGATISKTAILIAVN